ncbi:MAG: VWA domain-containing protein [Pseudomonadales bacterium]|nr:VWA domain-containing protein [Pseudomonadales bacterium]
MKQKKSLISFLTAPFLVVAMIFISYISLFHNDAGSNIQYLQSTFGTNAVILINVLLLVLVIPVSLTLMEIITGEFGLERFKRIAAISIGMTTLGFATLQFIGAIATSSAEGATVVVEIVQQIAHFSTQGTLEQYGLVGMLTSDASGPWNSSVFPLLILIVWFIKRKKVGIETKQLHIPMIVQWILYAEQFLFGLDLQYTLLEIILMFITGSIFVWGMISFLVSMFRDAEKAEKSAAQLVTKTEITQKKQNLYSRFINFLAHTSFKILTFNPLNTHVNSADSKIKNKKGGFGNIGRGYVMANALQLTIAMTIAMFALVSSMQLFAVQIRMSDAEAALFGTAGLTSAPEAFVAFAAGPYINALLLVGSNIIDGWMSAIGQIILLGYAEIASNGAIAAIPLHPAIRFLTFLSWTQGMIVWATLALYAHKINSTKNKKLLNFIVIGMLIFSIFYYFGGAWYSAQALGYGAQYAQQSYVFRALDKIIMFLANHPTQQIALTLNIFGLVGMFIFWSGISTKLSNLFFNSEKEINSSISELQSKISTRLKRLDQQVIIVLDISEDMDKAGNFFKNKWIDLVFRQAAALGLILDDDSYVPVYSTHGKFVTKINHLLTNKNADEFIEKYIGRDTEGIIEYAPVIKSIFEEYQNTLTKDHDPILVLFITAGGGTDTQETIDTFIKFEKTPVFVQFLEIFGEKRHTNISNLEKISKHPGKSIDNSGLSSLPLYRITDAGQIVEEVLNKYPEYLSNASKLGITKENT